ncbi:hypothetical protein QM012_001889 [Aureobasidium pullulans]|uniref:Peptidase C14 caspase domain-containing protein n=1 Tax=Aureobasidium pullulans TaxID=5580 RepID=A0ABR0TCT5_AURPU
MFSGCRDEETSADAQINGVSEGAMSWAFLESTKTNPDPTYKEALHMTRSLLKASDYTQVPQLCVGRELDLNQPLIL